MLFDIIQVKITSIWKKWSYFNLKILNILKIISEKENGKWKKSSKYIWGKNNDT